MSLQHTRICIITSTFPFGTGESFFGSELDELISSGCEVFIYPMRPRGKARDTVVNPRVHVLNHGITFNFFDFATLFFELTVSEISRQRLTKNRIRFRQIFRESIAGSQANKLRKYVMKYKINHLHAYWGAGAATLAKQTSKNMFSNYSFTVHSWELIEGLNLQSKYLAAKEVRFISKRGLEIFKQIVNFELENAIYIPLGVKTPSENSYKMSKDFSPLKIACIANLVEIKGHRFLIEATKMLLDEGLPIELHIVGIGSQATELENLVAALQLESNVFFHGFIFHTELFRLYRENYFSLVVLPSVKDSTGQEEGVPVALMEAMAYGIPVISTSTGAIHELVNSSSGFLVPPENAHLLAHAIRLFMNLSLEEIGKLSDSCFNTVQHSFNSDKNGRAFAKWVNSLAN